METGRTCLPNVTAPGLNQQGSNPYWWGGESSCREIHSFPVLCVLITFDDLNVIVEAENVMRSQVDILTKR